MTHEPDIQRRRSNRLSGFDYSQAGAYFVTIVAQGRLCLFGEVSDAAMRLNDAGRMAWRVWETLPQRFPSVELDYFVVMPNHVHGVIFLHRPLLGAGDRATTRVAPTGQSSVSFPRLGNVLGAYKSLTTVEYARRVRADRWQPFFKRLWQRNYYERIIRDQNELDRAREYIVNNPLKWALDRENPTNQAMPKDRR